MPDVGNVVVAVSGAVYVAPVGAPAPTAKDSPLGPEWKDLGYVSDEGVSMQPSQVDTNSVTAWQSATEVRKSVTKVVNTVKFTMLEMNASTLGTFLGVPVQRGDREFVFGGAGMGRHAFVLDVIDGARKIRYYVPSAEVSQRGDVVFKNGQAVGLEVSLSAYPDASLGGYPFKAFMDVPATAAETLLRDAVFYIDADSPTAGASKVRNLGVGGSALDAQSGSAPVPNSNSPKFLPWLGLPYIYLPGIAWNYLSVEDSDDLDLVGDLDVRVDVALDSWRPAANTMLLTKFHTGQPKKSWMLFLYPNGKVVFGWSPDGTAEVGATSTAAVSARDGARLSVRATLDVDNGAGGHTVRFWTAEPGGGWVPLGDPVTDAGVTKVFASGAKIEIGSYSSGWDCVSGVVHRAELRNGIDGPAVMDVDTSVLTSGTQTTFKARTGQDVTIHRQTAGRKTVAVTGPTWLMGTDDFFHVADNAALNFGPDDPMTVVAVARLYSRSSGQGNIVCKRVGGGPMKDPGWIINHDTLFALRVGDGTVEEVRYGDLGGTEVAVLAAVRDRAKKTWGFWRWPRKADHGDPDADTTGSLANTFPMRIGADSNMPNSCVDGELFTVAVWRRALTKDEIALLHTYFTERIK